MAKRVSECVILSRYALAVCWGLFFDAEKSNLYQSDDFKMIFHQKVKKSKLKLDQNLKTNFNKISITTG